jgi:hypothetical protein
VQILISHYTSTQTRIVHRKIIRSLASSALTPQASPIQPFFLVASSFREALHRGLECYNRAEEVIEEAIRLEEDVLGEMDARGR